MAGKLWLQQTPKARRAKNVLSKPLLKPAALQSPTTVHWLADTTSIANPSRIISERLPLQVSDTECVAGNGFVVPPLFVIKGETRLEWWGDSPDVPNGARELRPTNRQSAIGSPTVVSGPSTQRRFFSNYENNSTKPQLRARCSTNPPPSPVHRVPHPERFA